MILLDSSVIIAFNNKRDFYHSKAIKLINELIGKKEELCISDYIFDECATVFMLRLKYNEDSVNRLENLRQLNSLRINEDVFDKTWVLFKEQNKKGNSLSFTDCSSIVLFNLGYVNFIATFDECFKKIDGLKIVS